MLNEFNIPEASTHPMNMPKHASLLGLRFDLRSVAASRYSTMKDVIEYPFKKKSADDVAAQISSKP